MRLKVGLGQIYPKLGDVRANLAKHLDYIERAAAEGVELIIFPEMSLTGYQVQDLVPEVAIRADEQDPIYRELLAASQRHQIDIVFGFVQEDRRQRFYIASAYLSNGQTLHIHHKVYLPTYGMFDDGRYFDPGESARAFDTRFGRVGMLICEDFWHLSLPYVLWMDGADLFIFTSCSPSRGVEGQRDGKPSVGRWVELANLAYGGMCTNFVLHCNRVGYEDGKNFWGGSCIVDPEGVFLTEGHYFDEMLITQTIDLNQIHRTRSRLPVLRDERPEIIQRELARILANTEQHR
jgi:predicted amidohydrolase